MPIINFSEINSKLPTRNSALMVDNGEIAQKIDDCVTKQQQILFHSNHSLDTDNFNNYNNHYYEPKIFGVLECGRKAVVILKNCDVHLLIKCENQIAENILKGWLIIKDGGNVNISDITETFLYPNTHFSDAPRKYLKINFKTTKDRGILITKIKDHNLGNKKIKNVDFKIATSNDDFKKSCGYYYNILSRTLKFNTAGWNVINNYKIVNDNRFQNVDYVIEVDIKNYIAAQSDLIPLKKDDTIIGSWDIETENKSGEIPKASDTDFNIFMMSSVFFKWHSTTPLYKILAVDVSTADKFQDSDNTIIVECANEREVLLAHMHSIARMSPDILLAFNGSLFDWPLYKAKLEYYGLLKEYYDTVTCFKNLYRDPVKSLDIIRKFGFRQEKVKIDATTDKILDVVPQIPGIIDIDIAPVFMALFPRAEVRMAASLNWYLNKHKLPSKEDMPIKEMFNIYRKAVSIRDNPDMFSADDKLKSADDMGNVAKYCIVDSIRPQQLFLARVILPDRREISNLSSVSLYESFYRANGMKVVNYIGSKSHEMGYAFSAIKYDAYTEDTYPGAYVFPPNIGLHNGTKLKVNTYDDKGNINGQIETTTRPITGLDFASLYPSLMMAYNLSPDQKVLPEDADRLIGLGYKLNKIPEFKVTSTSRESGKKEMNIGGYTVSHNNVDAKGRAYSYEIVNNKPVATYFRDSLPAERMGVLPSCVKELFDLRVPIKKALVALNELKEIMEKNHQKEGECMLFGVSRKFTIETLDLEILLVDAKQKAIKLISNTFYGQIGSSSSPVYDILIAGAVTTLGQENIKFVAQLVRSLNYVLHYGDTDSLYLSANDTHFAEIDAIWELNKLMPDGSTNYEAKEKWWTNMVEISMRLMNELRVIINNALAVKTGATYLSMAYEEVLFPCVLNGKKKYYGIPHMKIINFFTDELFVRGIEVVKQGQAEITKELGNKFMKESVSIKNEKSLLELGKHIFSDICNNLGKNYGDDPQRIVKLFKLTRKYKPNVDNKPVLNFVEKMEKISKIYADENNAEMALLYKAPEFGDKFDIVVTVKPKQYNELGNIITPSASDAWEYTTVFVNSLKDASTALKINVNYYLESITTLFARFIGYNELFDPAATFNLNDDYKSYDIARQTLAVKYLENIIKSCNVVEQQDNGAMYKKYYKFVVKCLAEDNKSKFPLISYLLNGLTFIDNFRKHTDVSMQNELFVQNNLIKQINQLVQFIRINNDDDLYEKMESMSIIQLNTLKINIRVISAENIRKRTQLNTKLKNIAAEFVLAHLEYEKLIESHINTYRTRNYNELISTYDDDLEVLCAAKDALINEKLYYEMHNIVVEILAVTNALYTCGKQNEYITQREHKIKKLP